MASLLLPLHVFGVCGSPSKDLVQHEKILGQKDEAGPQVDSPISCLCICHALSVELGLVSLLCITLYVTIDLVSHYDLSFVIIYNCACHSVLS